MVSDTDAQVDGETQSLKTPIASARPDPRNALRLNQLPSPIRDKAQPPRTHGARFIDYKFGQRPPQPGESPPGTEGSLHSIHFTEARWNSDEPRSFSCDIEKLERNLQHVSNRFCSLANPEFVLPEDSQLSPSGLTPAMEEVLSIVTPVLMSPRHSSIHKTITVPSSPSESHHYPTLAGQRQSLPSLETVLPKLGQFGRDEGELSGGVPAGDLSGRWLSYGFMAAFYSHEGCYASYHNALRNATETFNEMIKLKDPQLLTSQIALMAILHCVGQQDIAFILIHNAYILLRGRLSPNDPILVVAEALKNLAIKNNSEYPFVQDLRSAYLSICEGERENKKPSPNAIAALYAWSFCQLYNREYGPAKPNVEKLYKDACRTLSQSHLVTIAALNARARVSTHLKDHEEALSIHRAAEYLSRCVLGVKHPMHLEVCRRLSDAVLVEVEGSDDERLEIKRTVFQHRFTMLGPHHPYTNASKESLVQFLEEKGRLGEVTEVGNLMKDAEKHPSWKVEVWTSY